MVFERIMTTKLLELERKRMESWNPPILKYFLLIIASSIVLLTLTGCATTQGPLKKDRGTFMQRAQTKRQRHVEVTVAITSESEAEDLFGARH